MKILRYIKRLLSKRKVNDENKKVYKYRKPWKRRTPRQRYLQLKQDAKDFADLYCEFY